LCCSTWDEVSSRGFCTACIGLRVRTSEAIPRGAFVFELAGEILTNAKQIVRNYGVDDEKT
jgi:hypothetical protein